MKKFIRFAACALAVLCTGALWADIQVDNVAALSGLTANGGNYARVQFQLDDQRFAVTGAEELGDVVWVKSIGVVQRPSNTIAANSTLRIQQSTAENANTGISSSQNAAVIAISQPLSASSTATLTVGTASQTLRTYTFAAPFPLKKSTLYTASFYNASGTAENQQLAMYRDATSGTTQNTNTTIHASQDANFSPCVRITAVERSKIADVGATANWSDLWSEAPAETDTVGLNVTAANAALTMDTSATVAGLAIGSETAVGPLIFSGSGSLTSTTTSIATDTNVSAITANLGAVTLASGKTLTVGNATTLSGLVGEATSQVVYDLDASLADDATRRNLIQNFPGVVTFKATGANGATLAYAANSTVSLSSCLAFDGGTHTFKYGRSTGQGYGLFATGRGDDVPTIDVKNGTTLDFYEKDLSGWNGTVQTKPAVIRVRNGGTLNFQDYGGSGFFRDRLVLDGGASVTMAGSNFILHGGTQDAAHAQIAMLDSNTAVEATLAGQIGITNINGGQAEQKASTIAVGNNATLKASAKFVGTEDGGSLTKVGSGTLELSSTETNTSNALTISAGKVLIKNGSSWGTGAITVAESAALEVEVSSADTTKIFANTLSGAGTVKKLGAGTLSLTGSVSTPVEVAAGTLDIGTNRRLAVNALASGAVLKVKATVAELSAQTITLTVGASLTAVTTSQLSVVDDAGSAVEGFSAAVADGTLTITLPSVLPTLTVNADGTPTWTNNGTSNDWPTSGAVKVDASAVTTAKTITIPASEAARTFSTLTVVAPETVQVTIAVGDGNTIGALTVDGSVAMAVGAVNAITNSVTVNDGGVFEVVVAENEDLTLTTPISGAGKFAKGGSGTLTLGADITITTEGGSIVQSGTLKFAAKRPTGTTLGTITTSDTPNDYTSNAMGDVRVCKNAMLDLNGQPNLWLRTITLETGATYKNGSLTPVADSSRQLRAIVLEGDAFVEATANFGLVAGGYAETTLTLNGHTLTKKGTANFWLGHTTATNGILVATNGKFSGSSASWNQSNVAVSLSDVTLRCELVANAAAESGIDLSASTVTVPANATLTTEVADGASATIPFNTLTLNGTLTANCDITTNTLTHAGTLTANANITANTLTTTGARTLAGTGTVTVPDMSLGSALTVTGNLVIDRTSVTDPREFNNAIKVASVGSLTTKGNITWKADSNEFLGSLTVASGTLTIKTPDQKLGGNVTIASDATLTIAKTVTTTTTGVITGGGKLVIGDGSTATSVTLNGTLGTVTGEEASATYEGYLTVAAGSELHLKPTLATTLAASVTGAGKVVIGDGTAATQVTQAAVGCDISAIEIADGATYTVSSGGKESVMLPATTTVKVAEGGKLVISTPRQMNANVTGKGEVEVTSSVKYVFAADQTNRLAPGKLTLKDGLVLHAARNNDTGLSVNELTFENATLSMELAESVTTKPVVTVATGKVLSGSGRIAAPIVFEDGAIFDAERLPEGKYLDLKDATITWPEESGTVTVKTSKTTQLIQFKSKVGVSHFTLVNTGDDTGLYLYEGAYGSTSMLNVLKKMDSAALPTEIAGNEAVKEAIQAGIEKWTENDIIITEIKAATAQSTAGVAQGSVQALDCFTNLETTVTVEPDWEGGDVSKGIATVTYDFGVSQITVKKAQLAGDVAAQNYVLACAKVSNGKTEEATAAGYATGTTVSLLLGGTEATGAVALDKTTLSNKFGVTAGLGERWFAVPLSTLGTGTHAFTVKAAAN